MRSTRPLTAVLATLALASCSDAVQSPTELTLPPAFARGGAVVIPNEEIVVELDNILPIDCAGEDVRFEGEMLFRLHQTMTPSGVSVLHVTIPTGSVTATGQTTGRVWTQARGASSQTIVRKDGETKVVNVSRNETYLGEDGSSLRLHHTLHIKMRDGEPFEVETEEWTCRP